MNKCEKCDLHLYSKALPVGRSDRSHLMMFIGDVTTSGDVKAGSPFNGKVTKLVKEFIDSYRLTNYVDCVNIVRCLCSRESGWMYKDKCIHHTINDIILAKPKIIVTIGTMAYRTLKDENNRNLSKVVNKPTVFANSILIPLYSPQYIIKNDLRSSYVEGFQLISDIYSEFDLIYKLIKP